MRINIKPLSVNEAWQGRRFKTDKYKKYEKDLLLLLPKVDSDAKVLKSKKAMSLNLIFGLSSKNADIDNGVKPFIDILQKKYGFNDKKIYYLHITKEDVKKGKEYIDFEFHYFY